MDNLTRHISYLKNRPIQEPHKKTGGVTMVQQLRKSITALVFFAISASAAAQAPSSPLVIKPEAPDRYVVVPGDTLWGISQKFTDSPWRWPELWGFNKDQIRNPHLFYAGYVIVLDRARGQLSIGGAPTSSPSTSAPSSSASDSSSVKLGPRMRAESLGKELIPSIPAGII